MRTGLHGSAALVTGATGALGRAIARALATEGARLALAGRDVAALRDLAAELPASAGGPHVPVAADLRDPAATAVLVQRCEAAVGPLGFVVHNAAVEYCAAFERLSAAEIEEIVAVNLVAPMEITRRAVPGMLARRQGHVVFISSISGYAGTAYQAPYAATKGGLNALVASLRAVERLNARLGLGTLFRPAAQARGRT